MVAASPASARPLPAEAATSRGLAAANPPPPPIKVIVKKANIKVTPTKLQSSTRLVTRIANTKLTQISASQTATATATAAKTGRDLAQRAKQLAATGNYDELISSKYRKDAGKMRHQCKICGYDSFHRNAIIRHMRTHTGETPFKCGYCTYSSSQKANLMRHLKQHAGGRQVSPKDVVPVDESDDVVDDDDGGGDDEVEYYSTQNLVPNA